MKNKNSTLSVFTSSTKNRINKMCGIKISLKTKDIGYSNEEFISHIESTFLDGMSWENRSKWHIDHIKPVSDFIKDGNLDITEINKLTNLRALWVKDNLTRRKTYNAGSMIKIARMLGVDATEEAIKKEEERRYSQGEWSKPEINTTPSYSYILYKEKQNLSSRDLSDCLEIDQMSILISAVELGLMQIKELAARDKEKAQELVAMNDFKARG